MSSRTLYTKWLRINTWSNVSRARCLAFVKVSTKQLSPDFRNAQKENIPKYFQTRQSQKSLVRALWRDFCFKVGFMVFFFPGLNNDANLMRIKTVKEPTKSFGYTATERGSPEKEISSGCFADRRRLSVIKEILPLALRNASKTLCWYISADTCSSWSFAVWQGWRDDG